MAKKTGRFSKGFFFAVMALALLSLVLLTVQVWVKTFEQSDYRASQRFKGEAMRSILTTVSDSALSQFASASAFYATYKLVNYTSDVNTPLTQRPGTNETSNPSTGLVENTTRELMLYGRSEPNSGRPIAYSQEENRSYTIKAWQAKINAAAAAMGFVTNFSEPKNFSYYQIDPWTVGVSFGIDMNITDAEGAMRQTKTMRANANFSISGFLDPSITRNDMSLRSIPRQSATEKQIFKLEGYNVPADVAPWVVDGTGPEGNGWFFGPITEDYPSQLKSGGVNVNNLKQYILVHRYDSDLPSYADFYGAVIVTTQPGTNITGCEEVQTECLNCMKRSTGAIGCPTDTSWQPFANNNKADVPVIVTSGDFTATNGNLSKVMEVSLAREGETPLVEKYLLIDNRYDSPNDKLADGYHRVWDITKLRDMAICGFYVKGNGPSFFQRMLAGAPINNPDLGIESFVVGRWAGGADYQNGDDYSRLDWEFYSKTQGPTVSRIKGMMGCKNREMCTAGNANATEMGVGKFKLSSDAFSRYFAGSVSCSSPGAFCD